MYQTTSVMFETVPFYTVLFVSFSHNRETVAPGCYKDVECQL